MGNGLTVKREVFLTKADSLILDKVAKAKRRSQSSLIREALVEWFARNGLLSEEETVTLGFASRTTPLTDTAGTGPRLPGRPPNTKWSP